MARHGQARQGKARNGFYHLLKRERSGKVATSKISVTIQDKSPLLMNKFTDEAQMQATTGQSGSLNGDRGTPHEQAEKVLYTDEKGQPIIPQTNLYRCIMEAGKYFKAGRSKVTTQKSSILPSCLDMDGLYFPLIHKEPWTVDARPVRIPATGGRILRYRPCFHDWQVSFEGELDTTVMAAKMLRDLVDKAGKAIGLGDFRPDCKGPFGKFVVTSWTVKK